MSLEPKRSDYTLSNLSYEDARQQVRNIDQGINRAMVKLYSIYALTPSILIWLALGFLDYRAGHVNEWQNLLSHSPLILVFAVLAVGLVYLMDEVSNNRILSNEKVRKLRELQAEYKIIQDKIWEFETALSSWRYLNTINQQGYWLRQKGIALEDSIAHLLISKGIQVSKTKASGDGGIDLLCTINQKKIFIQCKGYKNKLGVGAIRDAAGVLATQKPFMMIVVCPAGFTKGSYDFARQSGVVLMSVNEILDLIDDRITLNDL
jgi:hypothetical protein